MGKNIEVYFGPRARIVRGDSLKYIRKLMRECGCGHYNLTEGTSNHNSDCVIYQLSPGEAVAISSRLSDRKDLAVKIIDSND
jgi:hypothetical protein